jgi:glycosyltransferase involved in cell wall biosynthesis
MCEAIDSALTQTYKNLEILVINDGSNDNGKTEKIALSYGSKIRYFTKSNGGVSSALNLGIKEMNGEYFSWLSHDDVYTPEKIKHQVNVLNSLSNSNTIIYGGYEVINHESKSLYFVRPDKILSVEKCNISLFPLLRGLIHGCTLLVPRKYFYEIGLFDETLLSTQDYDLWFKFLRIAPIHFDDHILVQSRVHSCQGTNKIVNHIDECNELWSKFLKQLTLEEMTIMEGSPYLFLRRTALFLANASYQKASELATLMAENTLSNIKISVIIPIYNRVNLAIEAIKSVIIQTHQNFELILVDDGSEDDLSVLLEECNKDIRIKYIRKKHNGVAAARNLGINSASGEYIAFLDSDDLFCDNKLKTQLRFMEDNGFLFSHTSYYRTDLDKNLTKYINSGTFSGNVFPAIVSNCPIAIPTVMGKTSLFRSYTFPKNIEIGEDICLWISISSRHIIGGIDLALSKVRVNSFSAAFNDEKQVIGLVNISSFVIHNEYLSRFSGNQVRYLLLSAAEILNKNQSKITKINSISTDIQTDNYSVNIIIKLVKSLYKYGLKVTWYKVYNKFRRFYNDLFTI